MVRPASTSPGPEPTSPYLPLWNRSTVGPGSWRQLIFSRSRVLLPFFLVISFLVFLAYPHGLDLGPTNGAPVVEVASKTETHTPVMEVPTPTTSLPPPRGPMPSLPPLFLDIKEAESKLPQHNLSLPFPEGQKGRYFYNANTLWHVGFNNVLENLLFDSHLAYLSNRAYVFSDYTWDITEKTHVMKHGHLAAAQVPLTTFLAGPTAGGSLGPGETAPRAVNRQYWELVCPQHERLVINATTENRIMGIVDKVTTTDVIMEKWADKLRNMEDRCIEINGWAKRIFDYEEFGTERVLPLWPSYSKSPIVKQFAWSDLVMKAVTKNLHRVRQPDDWTTEPRAIIKGLLAVHIRHGDYIEHCPALGQASQKYWQWNLLPELPDKYIPQPWNSSLEVQQKHMDHCYPSLAYILRRIEVVRREHKSGTIKRLFILTNAEPEFLGVLKQAIKKDMTLDIVTSRDLDLDWRELGAQPGIDMEIAARSEVFLGNGFSSLTTNINLLRLVRGLHPLTIRFW